ncbi:MAG: hypothetical protein J6A89_06475 [Clostridia bacterium]|nr:hypothetical protein [Clostridia bacterium]
MEAYILNIKFENWQNQLWFMNENTPEVKEKWQEAIKEIDSLRDSSDDAMSFQNNVIDYLKKLGFIRIQK